MKRRKLESFIGRRFAVDIEPDSADRETTFATTIVRNKTRPTKNLGLNRQRELIGKPLELLERRGKCKMRNH
jgi:hypothetical protein